MKRTQIYFPEKMHYDLMNLSKGLNISFSELLRKSAQLFIAKNNISEKENSAEKMEKLHGIISLNGERKSHIASSHNEIYDL